MAEIDFKTRLRRLKFRAWHRGTQEADLILGDFVDSVINNLTENDCAFLETLFEEQDQDILNWIMGKVPLPTVYDTPLMRQLMTLNHMGRRDQS